MQIEQHNDLRKVYIVTDWTGDIIKYIGNNIFFAITPDNYKEVRISSEYPVLNYNNTLTEKLIYLGKIQTNKIINLPLDTVISWNKKLFYKLFGSLKHIPDTKFTYQEALRMEYPIIAKPSIGQKSIGIVKFNTWQELAALYKENNVNNFDIFSKYIDIANEYRLVMYNKHPIIFMSKNPVNDKSKNFKVDDKKIAANFEYKKESTDTQEFEDIYDVCKRFFNKVDLKFVAFDIIIDKNGKAWIIELNTTPGVIFDYMADIYKHIYLEYYGEHISDKSNTELNDYRNYLLKNF